MNFRFKKPVYIGDTVLCTLRIVGLKERGWAKAEAIFQTQDQTVALEASLKGMVPGLREKEVMKAMVAEGDPTNKIK